MELPRYKKVSSIPAGVDNTIVFVTGDNPNEVSVHYEDQGTVYPIQGDAAVNEVNTDRHTFFRAENLTMWNLLKVHVTKDCLVWLKAVGGVGRLYFYKKSSDTLTQLMESLT